MCRGSSSFAIPESAGDRVDQTSLFSCRHDVLYQIGYVAVGADGFALADFDILLCDPDAVTVVSEFSKQSGQLGFRKVFDELSCGRNVIIAVEPHVKRRISCKT